MAVKKPAAPARRASPQAAPAVPLDAAQILALSAAPPKVREVEVPEMGGMIYVASVSVERHESVVRHLHAAGNSLETAWFVASVSGADGRHLFGVEDAPAIARLSKVFVDRVVRAALEVNGFTETTAAAKND